MSEVSHNTHLFPYLNKKNEKNDKNENFSLEKSSKEERKTLIESIQ